MSAGGLAPFLYGPFPEKDHGCAGLGCVPYHGDVCRVADDSAVAGPEQLALQVVPLQDFAVDPQAYVVEPVLVGEFERSRAEFRVEDVRPRRDYNPL